MRIYNLKIEYVKAADEAEIQSDLKQSVADKYLTNAQVDELKYRGSVDFEVDGYKAKMTLREIAQ